MARRALSSRARSPARHIRQIDKRTSASAAPDATGAMRLVHLLFAYSITVPLRTIAPAMAIALVYLTLTADTTCVWSLIMQHSSVVASCQPFTGWTSSYHHIDMCVYIYALFEVAFWFWFQWRLVCVQKRIFPPPLHGTRLDRVLSAIRNCRIHGEAPYEWLPFWSKTPLNELPREDLLSWLAWATGDREWHELETELKKRVLELVDDIEQTRGMQFKTRHGDDASVEASVKQRQSVTMRLSLDRVPADHRPLVYYLATTGIDILSDAVLYLSGFRRDAHGQVSFWIRKGRATGARKQHTQLPIIFVHGVGIGLSTYAPFIRSLLSMMSTTSTIVLLELPHVSMKLVDNVPTMQEVAIAAETILQRHDIPRAVWVGHSLGTCVVSAVHQLAPKLISNIILIDPVCFMLWNPKVVTNFCYRQPREASQIIMHYHVSREITISHYFHRHFIWHESLLLAEDVPKVTTVFICTKDDIYDADATLEYLTQHRIRAHAFHGLGHGAWMFSREHKCKVLNTIVDHSKGKPLNV